MRYSDHEDPNALVTAAEYTIRVGVVRPALVSVWRRRGKVQSQGKRGREHLYRYGDLQDVERATRKAVNARGGPCRFDITPAAA